MKHSHRHTTKLGTKNQVVIPKMAREKLGLKAGDELMILVKEDRVVVMPKPKDFAKYTAGLHKEVWQDDPNYLENERDSW
jgi:AbrB family looped-hinge helix DNA binding protein